MSPTVARVSQLFIPTLKEAPADAQVVSHKLLVRAGFIRQLAAGIYDYLPLARRTLTRIEAIVRDEMTRIGIERIMAAAIELHHDADGMIWPLSIAPYHATVLTLGREPALAHAAEEVCAALAAAGVEVLHDDRDERAAVKLKDADLIGIPIRIAVGKRGLAEGKLEWKRRGAGEVEMVAPGEVATRAAALVGGGDGAGGSGEW